jgi:hypothetical protein
MKTFIAHSDGKVLVPEDDVALSRGARYRVSLEPVEEPGKRGLPLTDLALELAEKMKCKLPSDLARNHDHYLHGRPKR